jgi:hypothetical protein
MAQPISRNESGHPCRRSPTETSQVAPAPIQQTTAAIAALGARWYQMFAGRRVFRWLSPIACSRIRAPSAGLGGRVLDKNILAGSIGLYVAF